MANAYLRLISRGDSDHRIGPRKRNTESDCRDGARPDSRTRTSGPFAGVGLESAHGVDTPPDEATQYPDSEKTGV